jgi:catechol 2,3-dioxygenase-like lactoylglutathione lyase family enzyme
MARIKAGHVVLNVTDVEASVTFYREALGMEVMREGVNLTDRSYKLESILPKLAKDRAASTLRISQESRSWGGAV